MVNGRDQGNRREKKCIWQDISTECTKMNENSVNEYTLCRKKGKPPPLADQDEPMLLNVINIFITFYRCDVTEICKKMVVIKMKTTSRDGHEILYICRCFLATHIHTWWVFCGECVTALAWCHCLVCILQHLTSFGSHHSYFFFSMFLNDLNTNLPELVKSVRWYRWK